MSPWKAAPRRETEELVYMLFDAYISNKILVTLFSYWKKHSIET
jgi:hypothetical protein